MQNLLNELEKLKLSDVSKLVNQRIKEFEKINSKKDLYKEMFFCILTANFNAERSIKIQKEIGDSFFNLKMENLANELKLLGYRFPNIRAKYICNARNLNELKLERDWIVKNVKGIGMKEASHFLRNVGFKDYAIIDFHIIDLLVKYGLIERPKILNKQKYLEIEIVLKQIAEKVNLNLAELDLYLWYMETSKILK